MYFYCNKEIYLMNKNDSVCLNKFDHQKRREKTSRQLFKIVSYN